LVLLENQDTINNTLPFIYLKKLKQPLNEFFSFLIK
jgi:hypothetical protein